MTAQVTKHLHLVAGAPDGIKKLRGLILELAVRGKLVAQHTGDEHASKLISRLRIERAGWLASQGELDAECRTMQRKLAMLKEAAAPFPIPTTWQPVRLIDCSQILVDCHNKTAPYTASGIPIIRTSNIRGQKFRLDDLRFVSEATYEYWSRRCPPRPGDIMFTREAPMGEAAIVPEGAKYCLGQRTMLIRPMHKYINNRYLLLALTEPHLLQRASTEAIGSTVKHLRVGDVENLAIPLPPLAEQHRIVAKVDELMALCDRLEADQADAEAAHAQLVQALLGSLTQATNAADFRASWRRLSAHFHTLFTTEASMDALKQMVLQLAVQGALVDGDVANTSASALLEQIGSTEGHVMKPAEPLWTTPDSWQWTQLGSLLSGGLQNGISPKPVSFETSVRCLTLGATTRGRFNESCFKYVELDVAVVPKYLLKFGDLLVQRANSIEYVGVSAIYDGADDQYIYPDLMIRMRVSNLMSRRYVHLCLSSSGVRAYMRSKATGTQGNMPKINQGTVGGVPIPVPPHEVQHRIVAKVDELLALCDQLKAQLAEARQQHGQLATVLTAHALA
jgi:type I restriction enzyme S subunit